VLALAACGDNDCPAELVPACPACAGGEARGGVFGAELTIGPDGLAAEETCGAAADYLDRVGDELGRVALPPYPTDPAPLVAGDRAGGAFVVHRANDGSIVVRGLDPDGTERFAEVFASPDPVPPSLGGIGVSDAGDLIVAGGFASQLDDLVADNDGALYAIALDRAGARRWALALQPAASASMSSLAVAADGRVFLAGRVVGGSLAVGGAVVDAPSSQVDGSAVVLVELDPGGALVSSFTHGDGLPALRRLAATADGAIAAAWFSASFGGDGFLLGTTTIGSTDRSAALYTEIAGGTVRWARVYDGPADQIPVSIAVAPSGAAFVTLTQNDSTATLDVNGATFRGAHPLLLELGR
jgi:hypothetical protein